MFLIRFVGRFLLLLVIAAGCLSLSSCKTQQPESSSVSLPKQPPALPEVTFTAVEEGWPPGIKGASDVRDVSWAENLEALNDERVQGLRQLVLQDRKVRAALGERFAFISADEVEPEKRPGVRISAKNVNVTFFSHSNNIAIVVRVTDSRVVALDQLKDYQPPEGREEVEQAIRAARQDPRVRGRLEGLEAGAIVTFLYPEHEGFGNRVLDVTFTRPGEFLPEFYALVDLTKQRVLAAGPLSERKGR